MILTQHGINSLPRAGGNFIEILGRKYPVVQIGNQLWMAENLQAPVATNYPPNGNASNVEDYGLLYLWTSFVNIPDQSVKSTIADIIPSGWRVPSIADFDTLFATVGGKSVASRELVHNPAWGFNTQLPGYRDGGGAYSGFNASVYFVCLQTPPNYFGGCYVLYRLRNDVQFETSNSNYAMSFAIRLVKDVA